ncbi:hypothetical protein CAG69_20110 [Vibrio sp. V43_P6S15P86]|uniref:Ig-like domain-containing protein n=1 Tax=Vibrio sp. V43_P6S15P86 TaxID=1938694 RepID=UPI0013727ED8|nr:Ig-like domain-containing protein [Vibrio sp. V43_P6S15P86]NAW84332.1 hypothetical protein [Vibrio sp. V43_P6S15P86]
MNIKTLWLWSLCSALLLGCNNGDDKLLDAPERWGYQASALVVTPKNATIPVGLTQQMQADAILNNGQTVRVTEHSSLSWSSSDDAIATIDTKRGVLGHAPGVVTITATGVNGDGSTVTDAATITVSNATVQSLQVTPTTASTPVGLDKVFIAMAFLSDGTSVDVTDNTAVTWTSSHADIANVSQGIATGLAVGTTTIKAIGSANGKTFEGSAVLTVTDAEVVNFEVTPKTTTVANGLSTEFEAYVTLTDDSKVNVTDHAGVSWRSSVGTIATITSGQASDNGVATGVAEGGPVTITATGEVNGVSLSDSAELTVTNATIMSVQITPSKQSAPVGVEQSFIATAQLSDGTTQDITKEAVVSWTSSDTNIATVTSGTAVGHAKGEVTIMASVETPWNTTLSGTATFTVIDAVVASIVVEPASATVADGIGQQFTATAILSDGVTTQDITSDTNTSWTSSDLAIATVSASGFARGESEGVTQIKAMYVSRDGTSLQAQGDLTVTSAVITAIQVTPPNDSVSAGLDKAFTATALMSNGNTYNITDNANLSWDTTDATIATITTGQASGNGIVIGKKVGTTEVNAQVNLNGEIIKGSATLTVTSAQPQSMAVTPAVSSIAKGTEQQYQATLTYSDHTTQTVTADSDTNWTSSDNTTATISVDGLVTGENEGNTTITASGTYDGVTLSATAELTVTTAEVVSLTVTPEVASVAKGRQQAFVATAALTDNSTVEVTTNANTSWTSSAPSVATITQGVATALEEGSTTITASYEVNGVPYNASATLNVPPVVLERIETPASAQVEVGRSTTLTATGFYSDGTSADLTQTVDWTGHDTSRVTVDSGGPNGGLVTGVAIGSTQTQAKQTNSDGVDIMANLTMIEVVAPTPNVVSWGAYGFGGDSSAVQSQLIDVQKIYSTHLAFAAVKADGSIVTWGSSSDGGDSSAVQSQLTDVQTIYSTNSAFAAVREDGSVVTWGGGNFGGNSSAVQSQLLNVQMIYSTDYAFAALKADGSVVTWGDEYSGGDSSAVQSQLTDVQIIYSNAHAFAAVKADGSVVTWGDEYSGGDSSAVQSQLTNVQTIYSTDYAFAALKADGSVVTWGDEYSGGDSSAVQSQLINVQTIYSNFGAFAALKADGHVVAWGEPGRGGDDNIVQSQLTDVQAIYSTDYAFAAVRADGSVVTWGDSLFGGDSREVKSQLMNVETIYSVSGSFAALKTDGSVVTWGSQTNGGDSSEVQSQLTDVQSIYSTLHAFAALKADGRVVIWGHHYMGGLNLEQSQLTNVQMIYLTHGAFAAMK